MNFLKAYLEQIKKMTGEMSRSARLAVGLLVVVIVFVMAWLIAYGAKPDRVPVFRSPLAAEESGHAQAVLRRQGIEVEMQDELLYVPADQREEAYAVLASESILPEDPASAFEELARESSWMRTEKEQEYIQNQVKQAVLSRLVSQFPQVRHAQVMLDPGRPAALGRQHMRPTGSVQVQMRRSESMNRQLIAAIADLVAGSVPGMQRDDVRVVDSTNGRSYKVEEDDFLATDRLEALQQMENYLQGKLLDYFGQKIPNVLTMVHVVPDTVQQQTRESTVYDPDGVVSAVTDSETESMTGGSNVAGGEPGVPPNTGTSIDMVGGSAGTSQERMSEAFEPRFTSESTQTLSTGAVYKEISASISVPRSFLIEAYKIVNPDAGEPDTAAFEAFSTQYLDQLRSEALTALNLNASLEDQARVAVSWYFDGGAEPAVQVAQAGLGGMVTGYGKHLALGGLAAVSLLMVMMLVRRRNPSEAKVESLSPLGGLIDTSVGEAEGEEGALQGIELDEDTIRTQKVVEHVADMVRQSPDTAANLVARWMQKK